MSTTLTWTTDRHEGLVLTFTSPRTIPQNMLDTIEAKLSQAFYVADEHLVFEDGVEDSEHVFRNFRNSNTKS